MSDLHNPLFDSEKEFLEQKKLEYERALRGEVEQIKEKTVQVGKVAIAGAGLAGSVWLITRLFSSRKPKPRRFANESGPVAPPKGKKDKKGPQDPNAPKSAAASAAVFQEALGFDAVPNDLAARPAAHEPDPFEPQPVAAVSNALAPRPEPASKKGASAKPKPAASKESWLKSEAAGTLGALAKAAWKSDVARGLISQAAAAGLAALVGHKAVKSAVEDAQAPKNPDLAASADAAAAGAGAAGPFSPAQPSTPDAPRQHPA